MSGLCIINLKKHNLVFEELNDLAKQINHFALENNLATFFNSYDYYEEIIKDANMSCFFLISNNWLYKNCDFLETNFNYKKLGYGWENPKLKKDFIKKFWFFDEILNIIFQYNITCIEIYISGTGGVDMVEDFDVIQTCTHNFLADLYTSIINHAEDYAYGFPNVKFEIAKLSS